MCIPIRSSCGKNQPPTLAELPDVTFWEKVINIPSDPSWHFSLIIINAFLMIHGLFLITVGWAFEFKLIGTIFFLDFMHVVDVLFYSIAMRYKSHLYPTLFGLRPKKILAIEAISLLSLVTFFDILPFGIVYWGHVLRFLRILRFNHFNSDLHKKVVLRTLSKLTEVFVFLGFTLAFIYVTVYYYVYRNR